MHKRHEQTFYRGYMDGKKTHETCSVSLAIRAMQIKIMINYHYIPIRRAEIENNDNSS